MIRAVAGSAEAGKDTIGILIDELWKEKHYKGGMKWDFYNEFNHVKFADGINKVICAITGYSIEYVSNKDNYNKPITWLDGLTLRDLKQKIGQGMKTILGENIWIKCSFTKVRVGEDVKITDLRFPLELEHLVEMKAILLFVERPGHIAETLSEDNKNHTSETSVSLLDKSLFNHILTNDGDRNQLKQRLKEALETHEEWNNSKYSTKDF